MAIMYEPSVKGEYISHIELRHPKKRSYEFNNRLIAFAYADRYRLTEHEILAVYTDGKTKKLDSRFGEL